MKEKILQMLRGSDGFVSGQQLCQTLGVSRTAVWKHIRQLLDEGYEIEAVTNRGYRLISSPDTIAAGEVNACLTTRWAGRPVRYFAVTDSTNLVAKRLGDEGEPEGTLVIADEQTAGRGRSGRHWSTPPGTNIAMSLLLRPQIPADRISMVTLVMGLAVAEAVRSLYGVRALIKWPNDVVVGGKKLSGTLTEMSAELTGSGNAQPKVNYIVIGTGINVNMTEFPEEIAQTATSLRLQLGEEVGRAALIGAVMQYFEDAYELFLAQQDLTLLMDRYNAMLVNAGRQVRILEPDHAYTAEALGINARGELKVKLPDGRIREVYAGEVSVRRPDGAYV